MKISIIGAGAAGCFCAIEAARRHPDADITVYESGRVPLAKVAVTGGGRCNLTNSFENVDRLAAVYPRGANLMKRALAAFGPADTCEWFEREGVRLVTQPDGCVFPESQDALQIVHTLEGLMHKLGVKVVCDHRVDSVRSLLESSDAVVLTAGGKSQGSLEALLEGLPVEVTPTCPSLYTLKVESLGHLTGNVIANAALSIAGTPFRAEGTLLLTDWGVSGPVTLRLSSYAARHLAENGFTGTLVINWLDRSEDEARSLLRPEGPKLLCNQVPEGLTAKVWAHIVERAGLRPDIRCSEVGAKGFNRLVSTSVADTYPIAGRAKFKSEFVTCGGVSLGSINLKTLEAAEVPGLFFAGEVLDVDAVTGGFNLQAAWSTAMTVARSI